MEQLKAGCMQFNVRTGHIEDNATVVRSGLHSFAEMGCGLVVLPEMWSAGFAYNDLAGAAAATPSLLGELQILAKQLSIVIVGSLPEFEDPFIYNTSYVVDTDGRVAGKYRKIHLFSLQGEQNYFSGGDTAVVCRTSAGLLGLLVCYDIRFPELARKLTLEGARILCVSAQWPKPRIEHWSLLVRSRALENQVYVVACNSTGTEGSLLYGGRSAIISPTGQVVAEACDTAENLTGLVDMAEIDRFRRYVACFQDRRPDTY